MTSSDIIALMALVVSFVAAIANYLYTKRTFEAASFPRVDVNVSSYELEESLVNTREKLAMNNNPEITISLTNLSSSVNIIDVDLDVDMKSGNSRNEYSFDRTENIEPKGHMGYIIRNKSMSKDFPDIIIYTILGYREYVRKIIVSSFNSDDDFKQDISEFIEEMSLSPAETLEYGLGILPESVLNQLVEKDVSRGWSMVDYKIGIYEVLQPNNIVMRLKVSYTAGFFGGKRTNISKTYKIKPVSSNHTVTPRSSSRNEKVILKNEMIEWHVQEVH